MSHRNTPPRRRLGLPAASLGILLLLSANAWAQGGPPAAANPAFVTLDRGDDTSFGEASLATSFFDGNDPDFNMRLDLYGQFVVSGGTGGYFALPVSYLADGDLSETAVGALELGGLHNLKLNPNTNLLLRGGISLPTASDGLEGLITNFANANARLADYIQLFPETTSLRLAASPIHRSGQFVFRADGGLDLPLSTPDDSDIDPLLRLNLGVGLVAGTTTLSLEFANVGTTGDVSGGEDRFIHSLAVAGRFYLGAADVFGALVVPLDADGTIINVDMTLVAGARIPIDM